MWPAGPQQGDERSALQAEAAEMRSRLRAIQERLAQLEPEAEAE